MYDTGYNLQSLEPNLTVSGYPFLGGCFSAMPHKHRHDSQWSRRKQLRQVIKDEFRLVFDKAFRDQEKSETVSTVESVLLDVDRGEVLWTPTYTRQFDVFTRR